MRTSAVPTTKPFTVRCKIHNDVEYTFKNLERIPNNEVLQITQLSDEEMSRLYEDVIAAIKRTDDLCVKMDARPAGRTFMPLPLKALTVADEWCRNKRCDYTHVAEQIRFPIPKAEGTPIVALRKSIGRNGRARVFARVCDGVHRVIAETERGEHKNILCSVTTVATVEEEADIYSACNYNRRAHARIDIFKGRKCAKDPTVADMVRIAKKFNLNMPTSAAGRAVYPDIRAVNAVEAIYQREAGETTLSRVFELITQTSAHWRCVDSLGTDMLQGLAMFIEKFEYGGFVNSTVVEQLFHECTPNIILKKQPGVPAVEAALHVTVKSHRSQGFRHQAICTALFDEYTSKVRRMQRDKTPGASQLRKLLDVWHAVEDSETKRERVVSYVEKAEELNSEITHKWRVPTANSGCFPSHKVDARGFKITRK